MATWRPDGLFVSFSSGVPHRKRPWLQNADDALYQFPFPFPTTTTNIEISALVLIEYMRATSREATLRGSGKDEGGRGEVLAPSIFCRAAAKI